MHSHKRLLAVIIIYYKCTDYIGITQNVAGAFHKNKDQNHLPVGGIVANML